MDASQVRVMKVVCLASSLVTVCVLAVAAYQENFAGTWRAHQADYRALLVRHAETNVARAAADEFRIDLRQLYLPELGRIDRCTNCHLGQQNPAAATAPAPLTVHPGDLPAFHPREKFGCTVCHQGQGRATTKAAAHGWIDNEVMPHVDEPLLRGEAVFTSCSRCHDEIDLFGGVTDLFARRPKRSTSTEYSLTEESLRRSLPGAERIRRGKQLVVRLGCLGCHQYRGRGGPLGPELTYVGDKTKHDFDFTNVKGAHTVEQWLFEHFKLPRAVAPSTDMPDMGLTDDESRDLAFYMMSLHRKDAPASHMPVPSGVEAAATPIRGSTLFAMFCSSCHGANGYGTTMRAGLRPDDADPWGRDWDRQDIVVERRGDMEIHVPSLHHTDTLAVVSDEYLRSIIAFGRTGTKMPAWSTEGGLTSDDITLLVDFIRGWDEPAPDLSAVSSKRGDARIGGALYRANCASCHGADGEGGIGVSLNSPTFLAVSSDAFLRDTLVYGRPNTAMPSWREFNAQEISDLLAFLRRWQRPRSDTRSAVAACKTTDAARVSEQIGATLYKANCVMCHGSDGRGDLAPSLSTQAFLTVVSDTYLAETLVKGRPGTGMPSWRHLSNDDVASLILYLRSWQTLPGKSADWHRQRVPRGDWDAGRVLFGGHCAACHGEHGEGATGPQLNNPVFLRSASNVMLREWIRHGKEGTEMRPFLKGAQGITELTERQIEDIVSYLRRLERASEFDIARIAKSPNGRPRNGARLYQTHCTSCHGVSGEGASGPALANSHFLRFASDGFLMATMALGRQGTEMRPVKRGPQSILGLTSDEVNDLVALLRRWEHEPPTTGGERGAGATSVSGSVPHRHVVPWNLARGRELFASNCAGCHGEEGRGSWAPELNNEDFLAAATDGMLQATIVRGRKGTAMRAFGRGANGLSDLSPQAIDDIVAYMRSWSTRVPSPMTIPAKRSLTVPRTNNEDDVEETTTTRRKAESMPNRDS